MIEFNLIFIFFCLSPGFLPVVGPTERWCWLRQLARPCYVALGRALICSWTHNLITLCIVHCDGVTTIGVYIFSLPMPIFKPGTNHSDWFPTNALDRSAMMPVFHHWIVFKCFLQYFLKAVICWRWNMSQIFELWSQCVEKMKLIPLFPIHWLKWGRESSYWTHLYTRYKTHPTFVGRPGAFESEIVLVNLFVLSNSNGHVVIFVHVKAA